MKKFISLALLSCALFADQITTNEAKNYIGEEKTVCGKVVSTYYARSTYGSPTFLTLDKTNPNEVFKAVIFADNRGNFNGAPEYIYRDKDICVTGMIEIFEDIAQIVVSSDFQIK